MDTPLYVFFTINREKIGKSWPIWSTYPEGWHLVGSGTVRSTCFRNCLIPCKFESEDQYGGPCSSKSDMKVKLNKYYRNLKKKDYIIKYSIVESYDDI